MATTFGVDLAWGRPRVSALQGAGVHYVCRYLSHDSTGKNLTHAEAKTYSDAGIWIVVVWESTANAALGGHGAGVTDAHAAEAQALACGMPPNRPIYFAVDFDAAAGDRAPIMAYLDGAGTVLGKHRVGVYGSYRVCKWALDGGNAAWAWQTYAWSGGLWDPRAQLEQYSNDHLIDGVGLDYDRATKADYGQWKIGVDPGPAPAPKPTPTPKGGVYDMPYGQLATGVLAETPISLPHGAFKSIAFVADNGLLKEAPAALRVAVHDKAGWYTTPPVVVDSTKGQTVLDFKDPGTTDGISIQRSDAGLVPVAWSVS
jgi:hypothetical protein